MNKQIDQKWFDKTPKSTRNKFNIQSLDDLHESDITTFTSFIIKVEGSKDIFWNTYGKAYICKLQILAEELKVILLIKFDKIKEAQKTINNLLNRSEISFEQKID